MARTPIRVIPTAPGAARHHPMGCGGLLAPLFSSHSSQKSRAASLLCGHGCLSVQGYRSHVLSPSKYSLQERYDVSALPKNCSAQPAGAGDSFQGFLWHLISPPLKWGTSNSLRMLVVAFLYLPSQLALHSCFSSASWFC